MKNFIFSLNFRSFSFAYDIILAKLAGRREFRTGWIQKRRDSEKKGFRKEGIQKRRNSGEEGYRTRRDEEQVGCRTVAI